jgi:hypothetical protein
VAGLGECRCDRGAVLRPSDVGHCHCPGHLVIVPWGTRDVQAPGRRRPVLPAEPMSG